MNMLLTLLTLIAIFLIHRTLGNAFDSQCNYEYIFQNDLRGIQCVKEMLSSDRATIYTNPRKSETNISSAFEQFYVPISNDVPASTMSSFLSQLIAVPTSSFLHFHVPTNATSTATGLTSLNDITITHVSATTATTTATMTQVPATATMNAPKYQIDKCKATQTQHKTRSPSILHPAKKAATKATLNLLLPFNQDNSAIRISSLLPPFNQGNPAITMATHAKNLLLYAQIGSAITTATHAQKLLLYAQMGSAITTVIHAQNLLLFFVQNLPPRDLECPAITTAMTNSNFTFQLIVELLSTETKQVAPATILDDAFKLIDVLASEGAMVAPYIFKDAFNCANKSSKFAVVSQAMVPSMTIGDNSNGNVKPQQLIVIYSKRSLHFREDCGIFCEGEWEQQQHLDGHTGLVDFIGIISLVSLVGFICIIDFIGIVGIVGIVGVNGFVVGIIGLAVDLIGRNGLIGCIGRNGNIGRKILFGGIIKLLKFGIIGQVGLVGLIDIGDLSLVGHSGLSLVGHTGLSFDGHTGLVRYTGLVSLINLVIVSLISLVDLALLASLASLATSASLASLAASSILLASASMASSASALLPSASALPASISKSEQNIHNDFCL